MATEAEIRELFGSMRPSDAQQYATSVLGLAGVSEASITEDTDIAALIAENLPNALKNLETYSNELLAAIETQSGQDIVTAPLEIDGVWDAATALRLLTTVDAITQIYMNTEATNSETLPELKNADGENLLQKYPPGAVGAIVSLNEALHASNFSLAHARNQIHIGQPVAARVAGFLIENKDAINAIFPEDPENPGKLIPDSCTEPFLMTDPDFAIAMLGISSILNADPSLLPDGEEKDEFVAAQESLNAIPGLKIGIAGLNPSSLGTIEQASTLYGMALQFGVKLQTPLSLNPEAMAAQADILTYKIGLAAAPALWADIEGADQIKPFDPAIDPYNLQEPGFQESLDSFISFLEAQGTTHLPVMDPMTGEITSIPANEMLANMQASFELVAPFNALSIEAAANPAQMTLENDTPDAQLRGTTPAPTTQTPVPAAEAETDPNAPLVKALEIIFGIENPDEEYDEATQNIVKDDLYETFVPLIQAEQYGTGGPLSFAGKTYTIEIDEESKDILIKNTEDENDTHSLLDPKVPHGLTIRLLGQHLDAQESALAQMRVNATEASARAEAIQGTAEFHTSELKDGGLSEDIDALTDQISGGDLNRELFEQRLAELRRKTQGTAVEISAEALIILLSDQFNNAEIRAFELDIRENRRILELFGSLNATNAYNRDVRERLVGCEPYDDILFGEKGYDRIAGLLEGNEVPIIELFDKYTERQEKEFREYFDRCENDDTVSRAEIREYANDRFAVYAIETLSDPKVELGDDNSREAVKAFIEANEHLLGGVTQAMIEGKFVPYHRDVRLAFQDAAPVPRLNDEVLQKQIMDLAVAGGFTVPAAFILNNENTTEREAVIADIMTTVYKIATTPETTRRFQGQITDSINRLGYDEERNADKYRTYTDVVERMTVAAIGGNFEAAYDLIHNNVDGPLTDIPQNERNQVRSAITAQVMLNMFRNGHQDKVVEMIAYENGGLGILNDTQMTFLIDTMFESIDFQNIPEDVMNEMMGQTPPGNFERTVIAYYGQFLNHFEYHNRNPFNARFGGIDDSYKIQRFFAGNNAALTEDWAQSLVENKDGAILLKPDLTVAEVTAALQNAPQDIRESFERYIEYNADMTIIDYQLNGNEIYYNGKMRTDFVNAQKELIAAEARSEIGTEFDSRASGETADAEVTEDATPASTPAPTPDD